MAARWVLAFTLATVLAVAAGAILRNLARRSREARALRRSGGIVVLAALVGLVFAPDRPTSLLAVVPTMIAFAAVGVLADRGRLRGRALSLAILAAAVVPVLGGIRVEFLGVPGPDTLLTVVWVGGAAAAVAGLGNTDGLVASVAAASAGGIFALAAFGDQDGLAALAAGIAGAALGFLAYNLRPASLYIGQAGGLSVGAALAVTAIEVEPAIDSPGSLVVPLILLGLPIADAAIVLVSRLRYRLPLATRRSDHLPHRLRARGWRASLVVRFLVAVQALLSAVALFVGRGVLSAPIGAAAASALVLVLVVFASGARVHEGSAPGLSARVVFLVLGVGIAAVLVSIPGTLAAREARGDLEDGRRLVDVAITAARNGEPDVAAERFAEAAQKFGDARDRLHNPAVLGGLAVPVVGSNLHAARVLSDAGLDISRAGEALTGPVDPDRLRFRDGTMDLEEVRRITPSLEEAASLLEHTDERVRDLSTGYLVEPVRDAIDEVTVELDRASTDAANGASAARLAPAILGGDSPRRYFLAVQNPAELRATGGFIGSWGILTAVDGTVDLEFIEPVRVLNEGGDQARTISGPEEYLRRYGRFEPALTWQNVNMSPDFPVVGEVIEELYPESGGEPIDGVIAVDPAGLAALLELTGPVNVEGWPEPITAENVVDVTLRDAYQAFEGQSAEREDFLGDVAEGIVEVATDVDLGRPGTIADALGRAAREGHLAVHFARPEEEALAELVNVEGSVPSSGGDSLMVVTQNAGANKADYYLRRHVEYAVTVDPAGSGGSANVRGTVDVTLENSAPSSGLPREVIGPAEGHEDEFVAGENFAFVSVYTPLLVTDATVDNAATELEDDRELGRNVYAAFVSVFAESTTTMSLDVEGAVSLGADDWYTLELVRQPFLAPDVVSVQLQVPSGWRIVETDGLEVASDRRAEGTVNLEETSEVGIRVEPAGGRNIWDRLHHGP